MDVAVLQRGVDDDPHALAVQRERAGPAQRREVRGLPEQRHVEALRQDAEVGGPEAFVPSVDLLVQQVQRQAQLRRAADQGVLGDEVEQRGGVAV